MKKSTVSVPSFKLTSLLQKINKLNKKAEKLGMEPTVANVTGTVVKFISIEAPLCGEDKDQPYVRINDFFCGGDCWPVEFTTVEITENAQIKIAGWEFIAVVEFRENQNMLYTVKEEVQIPEKYRTSHSCEHCNTNRRRNRTFVLKHDSGEFKAVGSTCLVDFTGHSGAEAMADMLVAKYMNDVLKECDCLPEDYEKQRRGDHQLFSAVEIISRAILIIKEYGEYVSYSDAQERHVCSTVEVLKNKLFTEKAPEDNTAAEKLIAWFTAKFSAVTENSGYVNNLKAAIINKFVPKKDLGILASFPAFAVREQEKERLAALTGKASGQYVGNIGDRIQIEGTLVSLISFQGRSFGYSPTGLTTKYIWKIVDAQGNLYVWFTEMGNVEKGATVKLVGTVKEYKTYKDEKQTVLTRCRIQ